MCHAEQLSFAPEPEAAGAARSFVGAYCADWGLDEVQETAALLTSELVTNGVLHARTEIQVDITAGRAGVRIDVTDSDPRPPVKRDTRADLLADIDEVLGRDLGDGVEDERHALMNVGPAGSIGAGRGLLLVDALADEWGVELHSGGKSVWFEVHPPDAWLKDHAACAV